MYSDDKIIEGIIRSDAEAYRMLFRRYYVVVHNFIQRFIKDADSAEDIAQNIFLKIWQGRHCLDSKRSIKGLLFAMAKNESLNFLKSRRLVEERRVELFENVIDNNSVTDIMDALELDRNIVRSLNSMPEQRRKVFVLSRYRNMSNEEIATLLKLSKRTVEGHISEALKGLRKSVN